MFWMHSLKVSRRLFLLASTGQWPRLFQDELEFPK